MVKLVCTYGTDVTIFECPTTESVDKVTADAAKMHNLRLRVNRLAAGVKQLALYGPMRTEEKRGLTEEQLNYSGKGIKDVAGADPLGIREGVAPNATVVVTLNKCAAEAEAAVSDALAKKRTALDRAKIEECIQNIKGAVMMAYPMGLPVWDVVKWAIEDDEDLTGMEESKSVFDIATCSMWFAGKQMMRDEVLSKYVGKNEKCIVQIKFTHKGSGAPQRAPAVDEDTQKKMMAYWHKKQAAMKELEENDEDSYMNSSWANPKSYKNQMNGLANVRIR